MPDNPFFDPEINREIEAKILRLQAASLEWDDNPDGRSLDDFWVETLVESLNAHAEPYLRKVGSEDLISQYREYMRSVGSALIRNGQERGLLSDPYSEGRLREMAENSGKLMTRVLFLEPEKRESEIQKKVEQLRAEHMPEAVEWHRWRGRILVRIESRFEARYRHWQAEAIERVRRQRATPNPPTSYTSPTLADYEAFKSIGELIEGPHERIPEAFFRYSISRQLGINPEDVTWKQVRHAVTELLPRYKGITVIPDDPTCLPIRPASLTGEPNTQQPPPPTATEKPREGTSGRKRGPKADPDSAARLAEIVARVAPDGEWRVKLGDICEALDEAQIPFPSTWRKRDQYCNGWADYDERANALKAIEYRLEIAKQRKKPAPETLS